MEIGKQLLKEENQCNLRRKGRDILFDTFFLEPIDHEEEVIKD